jgi:chemotaxis protein methyltransferase CheR
VAEGPPQGAEGQLEEIEIALLLEGVFRYYGADFRNYAPASLRRRIRESVQREGVGSVSALQAKLLHDPACLERFLHTLSINVTSMFRDPSFYLAFRAKVVPLLRTYPFVRVWHAGCSTGEEVYSMAILLQEEGLYPRCRIYATDMNPVVLRKARESKVNSGAATLPCSTGCCSSACRSPSVPSTIPAIRIQSGAGCRRLRSV